VLPALMDTPDAQHTMYVDSHTTRRALEIVAEQRGIACVALGLHTSDLVAGLLNGFMTGYPSGSLPKRACGELTFIYPLAFLQKKELHLYYSEKTGGFAGHARPNTWEHDPADRNFYYYLADVLQDEWPGLELMLLTAQERASRIAGPMPWSQCANCGSAYPQIPLTSVVGDECDVCRVLRRAGFLTAQPAPGAPIGP
jgi:tRNA(Ile)-lysidine synthase TilS/MesJ